MKIGVNLTHLNNFDSGSKTYFINLFESLLRIDKKNHYYFFFPKTKFKQIFILQKKIVK